MNPVPSKSSWNDEKTERIIGNLLRIGVFAAAAVVVAGALLYLLRFGHAKMEMQIFHGEPADLSTVGGIIRRALTGSSRGLIQLGLLILVATPVARVAFSLIAFILERDWIYIVVTLIVLSVLAYSLLGVRG